jgi:hypothetical protein
VRGDIVYMHMHPLFKGAPPRFCIRDLDAGQKSDIRLGKETDTDSQMSGVTASGAKCRAVENLTKEDCQGLFQRTAAEEERDKAAAGYYKTLTRKSELEELSNFITGPEFSELDVDTQEALRTKHHREVIAPFGIN